MLIKPNFSRDTVIALAVFIALAMLTATASAAVPTPLSSCQAITSSGNYVLTKDISAAGNCFVLTSDGTSGGTSTGVVGLDLNKHTITGPGTGSVSAITDLGTGAINVAIVNGKITGFNNGIELTHTSTPDYTSNVTIDNINSSNNKNFGVHLGGEINTVTNSTFDNNGGNGLEIDHGFNTVAKVVANGNAAGILTPGCCNLITDSAAMNNAGNGVEADGGDSYLADLKVEGNGAVGIEANDGYNIESNCTAEKNTGIGVSLSGGDNAVDRTKAEHNGNDGINMTGGNNLVNQSTASDNGGDGIALDRSLTGQGFDLVTNSNADGNSGNGITLTGTDAGNAVVRSTASRNQADGVDISCPGNIIKLAASGNGSNLVNSGTCTQDLSPMPVSACGTTLSVAGAYKLTKSLTSASGNCITIGASGIAIDLGGHSITGPGSGSAIADGGNAFSEIIVANGAISKFATGIDLSASNLVSIDSITSSHNTGVGINIGGTEGETTATSVTVENNGSDGLDIMAGNDTVANVVAANNGGNGISQSVAQSQGCNLVSGVSVLGNGGDGLFFGGGDDFVDFTKLTGNGSAGFTANTGRSDFIFASAIANNGADGADVLTDDAVDDSKLEGNKGEGVFVAANENVFINGTTANNNGEDGFQLNEGAEIMTGSTASHNQGDGVVQAAEGVIVRSTFDSNLRAGASVGCPGNVVAVTALHNAGGNLSVSGCVSLNNNAP